MAAAVAYAVVFMPKSDNAGERTGSAGDIGTPTPGHSADTDTGTDGNAGTDPQDEKSPSKENSPTKPPSSSTQTTGPEVAQGFTLRKDTEGFRVAVANGWDRTGKNGRGQIVYSQGDFELLVVPGRDTHQPVRHRSDDVPA